MHTYIHKYIPSYIHAYIQTGRQTDIHTNDVDAQAIHVLELQPPRELVSVMLLNSFV